VADDISESLSKTNKELDDIVKKLAGIEKSLKTIGSSASKVPGAVRGATKGGGDIGNMSTSTSMMPSMAKTSFGGETANQEFMNRYKEAGNLLGLGKFSNNQMALGIAQGGMQMGMGLLGGAMMAAPSATSVMASSANYYGASIRSGGLGYQQITKMTMQGLGPLGITGEQSPAATAGILAARGVMPGTAQFKTMMQEIGGTARFMNMANENSAVALSGLTQGGMSSRLYQAGISTFDREKGEFRGGSAVFNQILDRMTFGREKASVKDTMNSIQGGFLQQTANSLGMSEDQKQMFYQTAINRAGGGEKDLAKLGINGNPLEAQKRIVQSDVETLNAFVKPVLKGMENAADIVEAANRGLQTFADQLGYVSGLMGGIGQSRVSTGLGAATGGFLGGAGTILGALGVKSLLKGGASKISGALKGAFGKIGGVKGLLGRAGASGLTYAALEQGQKFLNQADVPDEVRYIANLLYDAGQGGLTGLATGNPLVALGGVAAGTTGAVVNPYGKGGPSGNSFGGSFGASQSQVALSSPVSGGLTSASYGDKGKIWNGGKHTGNDYPCPIGTDVRATMDGVVYNDNPTSEYGKTVQIDHGNGYQTLFGHLSKVLVSNGQQVKKGDVIGKSGDTGNVDGPHVHYEVRKGKNNPVNPDQLKSGADGGFSAVNALTSASLTSSVSGAEGNNVALSKLLGSGTTTSLAQAFTTLGGVQGASPAYGGNGGGGGSANSKVILGTGSEREWATGLLGKLGAPVSDASINALTTWMRHEGGHWKNSANYNPLNTTYSMAGSTSMNSVGVKSYKSWEDGYAATVNTLTGKNAGDRGYSAIVSALKSGASTEAILGAINNSAWMTGKTGGTPYKFQGGSTSLSVASPSMSYSGGGANVTINATFNNATENEARQLVQLVKKELENSLSISTMGRN
jgi:murein DD-endopeptidase MepM/ murein hydrolase activator NlpD